MVITLMAGALGTGLVSPAVSFAATPATSDALPSCRDGSDPILADIATGHTGYRSWATTLVDTRLGVSAAYAPRDLVPVGRAGVTGSGSIRSLAIPDLRALVAGARAAGAPITVVSAYRSYNYQIGTFARWTRTAGRAAAVRTSARPGHSEHQLGIAIDVTSLHGSDPWTYADWATTKAGAWMAANAWAYGFTSSYPAGSSSLTCYNYEPWHYRYVGRASAAAIHDSGVTTREWLWARQ